MRAVTDPEELKQVYLIIFKFDLSCSASDIARSKNASRFRLPLMLTAGLADFENFCLLLKDSTVALDAASEIAVLSTSISSSEPSILISIPPLFINRVL